MGPRKTSTVIMWKMYRVNSWYKPNGDIQSPCSPVAISYQANHTALNAADETRQCGTGVGSWKLLAQFFLKFINTLNREQTNDCRDFKIKSTNLDYHPRCPRNGTSHNSNGTQNQVWFIPRIFFAHLLGVLPVDAGIRYSNRFPMIKWQYHGSSNTHYCSEYLSLPWFGLDSHKFLPSKHTKVQMNRSGYLRFAIFNE